MRTKRYVVWCCLFIIAICSILPQYSIAEQAAPAQRQMDELQSLLEKGLSIYEIERELGRIQAKISETDASIQQMHENMDRLQLEIEANYERAGEVLRQYYMGDRIEFISLLLQVRSMSDFLIFYDWVQILIDRDRKYLEQYQSSLEEENILLAELQSEQERWVQLEQSYSAELKRVTALQAELDKELQSVPDAELVTAEISRLTEDWENNGLPWFRTYFQTLANTIHHLPEWLMTQSDALSFERQHIAVHLSDDALNQFLLEHNDLFEGILFHFDQEQIRIEGEREQVALKISGSYVHQYSEETGNRLDFQIDEMYYNDYKLPDTTAKELKEQFDLSFYPDKMTPLLRFKEFVQEEGKLIIYFQL